MGILGTVELNTSPLGARAWEIYDRVARNPYTWHPLHRGPYYARN